MTTKHSLLPLAVIHQSKIFRNHILKIVDNHVTLTPFEQECEATCFVSAIIIVANSTILSHISKMPSIDNHYGNIDQIVNYLDANNLFIKKNEEPTLVNAGSSGYTVLS